tara:strand:- start:1123 stop:2103 length:981 start_codon:yes stop_codon:yes gene_type:complete
MAEQPNLDYQQETTYSAENSTTPGAMPQADPTAEQMAQIAASQTAMPEDANAVRERAAFETYVQNSGDQIPPNFKDAGAWFDSLKEAQKKYTQGQQEIAELKRTYAENNTQNPNYVPQQEAPAPEPVQPTGEEQLRIPSVEEAAPEQPTNKEISQEDWDKWGMEVAIKGDLTPETRAEIKQYGFTDKMVNDLLTAQQAKMREAYSDATAVVGGKEKLDSIFDWAAKNLSKEEQAQINVGLSGPAYEITLRGLADTFEKANQSKRTNEPAPTPGLEQSSVAYDSSVGYKTKREFYADRNNPRFTTDQRFRQAVESRMLNTDFNNLPA